MKISNEDVFYAFSPMNKHTVEVDCGSKVEIETYDCFSNQLKTQEDNFDALDWNRINPATGPIWVKGAEPGDLLKVHIHEIEIGDKGVVVAGKGMGVLAEELDGIRTKIISITEEGADFGQGRIIPLNKMIGVIGVAPKQESVNTGTPGRHGGNMDNKMVTEGATLYFPVEAEGALFGIGDAHAIMGDGEIGVSGLEVPAKITLSFDVIKNQNIPMPMLENEESWSVIASEETVDEAIQSGTIAMFHFLKSKLDLTDHETAMLMSLTGNLEICQVVDPLKTVRFVMPKSIMKKRITMGSQVE